MSQMFNLNNKVVILTGGCGGIGKAYTKALLENNVKGIGILDVDEEVGKTLVAEYSKQFSNSKVLFVNCDVSKIECMRKAFKVVVETFDQLDIVINNAGLIDELNLQRAMAINFIGVVNGTDLAKEYLPKFKSEEESLIINTSSIAGLLPVPCLKIYCATKAAILSYSRSLGSAEDYQKDKIKVITLCPGGTESNLISEHNMKNAMTDDGMVDLLNMLKITPFQSADSLARKVIGIIKKANHGEIWVVHKSEEELVHFPMLFQL